MKTIEVNLGIGMNMFFPEPVRVEIPSNAELVENLMIYYDNYLFYANKLEEPDYDFLIDDPNQNEVRLMTLEEFINEWDINPKFQEMFK
jgi:hypothetical protein